MRMPSKHTRFRDFAGPQAVVSLARFWLQTCSPFRWGVSTDWKSNSCPLCSQSETSFCGPRQR